MLAASCRRRLPATTLQKQVTVGVRWTRPVLPLTHTGRLGLPRPPEQTALGAECTVGVSAGPRPLGRLCGGSSCLFQRLAAPDASACAPRPRPRPRGHRF